MAAEETSQDILSIPVREFLAATAAKQPTPGGGSVAGVVAGLGVALGEMALNFTKGKKKYAEHEAFYDRLGGASSGQPRRFARESCCVRAGFPT